MNKNFNRAIKKNYDGNYSGHYRGYYITVYKRLHGKWCCEISKNRKLIWREGYFGTSLGTLKDVKHFIKTKIMPSYHG